MIMTSQSYANEETFQWYVKYLAMKRHFTDNNYDYHKYRGKIRASFEKYRTRSDVFFFHKLSQKDDPENLLLANMIVKPNVWIREVIEQEGEDRYIEWVKRRDTLTRIFKNDLNALRNVYQDNFISVKGQHPAIMSLYIQRQISLETFTILTHSANIFDYWGNNIVDKVVSSDIIRLSRKYYPFLNIDEKKFKDIVREHFF